MGAFSQGGASAEKESTELPQNPDEKNTVNVKEIEQIDMLGAASKEEPYL